jgi:hypothetical protein
MTSPVPTAVAFTFISTFSCLIHIDDMTWADLPCKTHKILAANAGKVART